MRASYPQRKASARCPADRDVPLSGTPVAAASAHGRTRLGTELLRLAEGGRRDIQRELRPLMLQLFDDLNETVLASLDDEAVKALAPARPSRYTPATTARRGERLEELAEVRVPMPTQRSAGREGAIVAALAAARAEAVAVEPPPSPGEKIPRMSVRVRELLMGRLDDLRYEPIDKRIRAMLGDRAVVDSRRALLVWEPKRIVPSYAVPAEDIAADVTPAPDAETPAAEASQVAGRPVYDPSVPFAVHTAPGEPVAIDEAAGFRLADPALDGYVELDFPSFDAWFEEDERNVGHPRDPFHRIDIVHGSRHVVVEAAGRTVAESTRPVMLFEPPLPVRYYLPPEDVALDLLEPSGTASTCAYKGHASYWSLDGEDVAWFYPEPLREAAEVTGLIAFFNERVDIAVDGEPVGRPATPWSRR